MNWSVKRAYNSRGGWIPCHSNSENADRGFTFRTKQEAIDETTRRNALETFEIKQEEVVFGFKGDGGNLVCFLVGASRAETDEGWVLFHGVPIRANVCDISSNYEDCMIVEDKRIIRYLRDDVLGSYLAANIKVRHMKPDGTYERVNPGEDESAVDIQNWLINWHQQAYGELT